MFSFRARIAARDSVTAGDVGCSVVLLGVGEVVGCSEEDIEDRGMSDEEAIEEDVMVEEDGISVVEVDG